MKRFFVALTILASVCCFSGCGEKGDDYGARDMYDASYAVEEDEPSSENEEDIISDISGDTQKSGQDEDNTKRMEPKGIIAALVKFDSGYPRSRVQVITIDPDTGEQDIVSEFSLRHVASSEAMKPNTVDESVMRYMLPKYYSQSMQQGNHRNWFSQDYTKMIANRAFLTRELEQHAGWVDTKGNFFDITEAVGTITERGFSDSGPVKHTAVGFSDDGNFVFYDSIPRSENTYYSVPTGNISKETTMKLDEWHEYYLNPRGRSSLAYPTCWLNAQECLADYYSDGTAKSKSIKLNVETGELIEYLPTTQRVTWNGVINSSQDTVAVAAVSSSTRDATMELYTAPLSGEAPKKITLIPNDNLLFNITDVTARMLFEGMLHNNGSEYCVLLLEWR